MSDKWVYFAASAGLVKIGITDNVKRRIEGLQASCPVPVTLIKSWPSADAEKLESALQNRFANWHRHHEWFEPPQSELEKVCAELDENGQLCREFAELENARAEQQNIRRQM